MMNAAVRFRAASPTPKLRTRSRSPSSSFRSRSRSPSSPRSLLVHNNTNNVSSPSSHHNNESLCHLKHEQRTLLRKFRNHLCKHSLISLVLAMACLYSSFVFASNPMMLLLNRTSSFAIIEQDFNPSLATSPQTTQQKPPPQQQQQQQLRATTPQQSGLVVPKPSSPLLNNNNNNEMKYLEGSFQYLNDTIKYHYSPRILKTLEGMAAAAQQRAANDENKNNQKLPVLFFGITSNPEKSFPRKAIRKSWAVEAPAIVFMVAGDWTDALAEEFHQYGDLLYISNMPEDYKNGLTPKTLALFHLAATTSITQHVDYVFKTDDDVYVNATEMAMELAGHRYPEYYGLSKPRHVLRAKALEELSPQEREHYEKWVMSREEYPEDQFPPHAGGVGYALSRRLTKCVASDALSSVFSPQRHAMPWEDVATGMLAAHCNATLAPAKWDHFIEGDALLNFPFETYKDGTDEPVKILHKVKPLYFEPLFKHEPLSEVLTKKARKTLHKVEKPVVNVKDFSKFVAANETTGEEWDVDYVEGSFSYLNETVKYRYSPALLQTLEGLAAAKQREKTNHDSKNQLLPTLLFGITSNPAKPFPRNAIRKSWGQDAPARVFIIAGDWTNELAQEFQHGDLLWISNMKEDYKMTLTPKTLTLLHLAASAQVNQYVDYVFKTDDDVYVNVTQMAMEMAELGNPDYYGLPKNRKVLRPVEMKTLPLSEQREFGKWALSKKEYPEELYPVYAGGTGYALSRRFAKCAADAISTVFSPARYHMPWEDVATGMLAAHCNIPLTDSHDNWPILVQEEGKYLLQFPYDEYKDGGKLVKILHKVEPFYFGPLFNHESLELARLKTLAKQGNREARKQLREQQHSGSVEERRRRKR